MASLADGLSPTSGFIDPDFLNFCKKQCMAVPFALVPGTVGVMQNKPFTFYGIQAAEAGLAIFHHDLNLAPGMFRELGCPLWGSYTETSRSWRHTILAD